MRPSRFVFFCIALLAVILLADVLAGTLIDFNNDTENARSTRVSSEDDRIPELKSRRRLSNSLKDRKHPNVHDEIRVHAVAELENTPPKQEIETVEQNPHAARQRTPAVAVKRFATHQHNHIAKETLLLMNDPQAAIDLVEERRRVKDPQRCNESLLEKTTDSKANERYARLFTDIFRNDFLPVGMKKDLSTHERGLFGAGLPWFLDEGGLIGSSRAGSLSNADDDFDVFVLLPNQTAPCSPHSTSCTKDEFHSFIHRFLMVFWNRGLCINKFNPDPSLFKSNMRLMYSVQLDRDTSVPPERCYNEKKPFAHIHLGIMVEGSETGEIETNIWARHTTHPIDRIPLSVVLPTTRCRVGTTEAPCPRDIVGFLKMRNRGEYFKKSSDGSCLLVRNKWGMERRKQALVVTENLDACGYNTMIALAPALKENNYQSC